MKKNTVKYIIIGIVLVVLAFFYSHISKMNLIYDKNVDNSEYREMYLPDGGEVVQKFICNESTLDGVSIKLKTTGVMPGDILTVFLCDSDMNVLAQSDVDLSSLKSGKFNKIKFNTVENVKDKTLNIMVTVDTSDPECVLTWYSQQEVMNETELYVDGDKTDGTMIIKTITDRFDLETFVIVLLIVAFIVTFIRVLYKLFK